MNNGDKQSSNDEALSALIDGSLPREQAAALRAQLEQEPALAARFAALERANRLVRDAYRGVVDEPLPERMLDLLREPRAHTRVAELDARRHPPRASRWLQLPQALAAGVVLAIGIAIGFGFGERSSETALTSLLAGSPAVAPRSPLHELLDSVPSGEVRALDGTATAEARLTFKAVDGVWCRELIVTSVTATNAALACRRDGDWRIELVGIAAPGGEVYRPAGADDAPFAEAVDSLIDGAPLEPAAERALLERGWLGD